MYPVDFSLVGCSLVMNESPAFYFPEIELVEYLLASVLVTHRGGSVLLHDVFQRNTHVLRVQLGWFKN